MSSVEGEEVVARVVLPGERGAYGGQDLLPRSEGWHLRRRSSYWVQAKRVWRPKQGSTPAVIYADRAPTRLP